MEIFREPVFDRKERVLSVRLLQEFGAPSDYLTAEKVKELWEQASQFDVLFSDWTKGRIEPFLSALLSKNAVWFEFYDTIEVKPVGVAYVTQVHNGFDAVGHFTFWDKTAKGREPIVRNLMRRVFNTYDLHRMTAKIPVYQKGVLAFARRLGFEEEGRVREAVIYKENWNDLILLGIVRDELFEEKEDLNNE